MALSFRKLFQPVESMDADQFKSFSRDRKEGSYTLLDVRQPREYEESHIPGATLVPLPDLPNGLSSLDPDKPTVVYCAVGGRSRVAAQMLSGKGFKEVFNLKGGIRAWSGATAWGPQGLNLDLLTGEEGPEEMLAVAYGLEDGLVRFYEMASGQTSHPVAKELLDRLAAMEEGHKERLIARYRALAGQDPSAHPKGQDRMEGGMVIDRFLEENKAAFQEPKDILQLALMVEAQALDLYSRFAQACRQVEAKSLLEELAEDEKTHLGSLGSMLNQVLAH